ncbi:MAG: DUF3078 domain-containing protein [Rikenellaceae bacterium]|nr:DUF3078 domain-containing protein [Rikenellaceae bacterium]
MKIKSVLMACGLSLVCAAANAQFTISTITPGDITVRDLRDSLAPNPMAVPDNYKNDFFDREFWQAEKRRLRRERHLTEVNATLQLSQTQFKNWYKGGDNTFNGISTLYLKHSHQRNKLSYSGVFDARYGMNFIDNTRFKNVDEFKINLATSWDINQWWSYAAAVNLRSQFSTSYKSRDDHTRVSTLMAPGFLDISLGFKYENRPFSVLLSPVGGNAVFVLDKEFREAEMQGINPDKKSKWTVGPSVTMNLLDFEFHKKVFMLRSELYSFTNMKKTPTVRWTTTFEIRATKFLTTTLYGAMYFDKESEAERPYQPQYNSVISVGLSYSFKSRK